MACATLWTCICVPEVQVDELAWLRQFKRLLAGIDVVSCILRQHVIVSLPLATSCMCCGYCAMVECTLQLSHRNQVNEISLM